MCFDDRGTQSTELEMISSRDPEAELIKVFVRSNEKERFKSAVASNNTNMSHLARALLLQWREGQEG